MSVSLGAISDSIIFLVLSPAIACPQNDRSSDMFSRIFICLLFLASSASAGAADDGIAVASIDRDRSARSMTPAAAPAVTEKYEYYEVRGDNEEELRCQMTENGCRWDDGKKYDSVTRWSVKWDYDYGRTPDSCAAESFKATVEVNFRYPQWTHTDNALKTLADKWERYMQNLVIHEKGHRDLAVEAAAELTRAVAGLPPAPTCADIDRNVKALCREHMKKLHEDQKSYDAATVHGVRQGAVFP